ncbi:MAG: lipopolysaccharide heptosyltransferase II [Bryobacteraceae bacterium]|nr:lipopolysaccharide heptosyltransferase II [Bryobacteraceae bacterium]
MHFSRILIRATNWVGDAVMSLPAIRLVRERFPEAHITMLAKPWVADLYVRERVVDRMVLYMAGSWWEVWKLALSLRQERFDCAILLQNALEAALIARVAGIPRRIGYNRYGRGFLLTDAIPPPKPGVIPRHESFYYLELLRRAGITEALPENEAIMFAGAAEARRAGLERFAAAGMDRPAFGVSPGAAFGGAKRWFPERFAATAERVARARGFGVALFGSSAERPLCQELADRLRAAGLPVRNFAGETTLGEFIEMAAACAVFLTNDSGPMHIAAASGIPTVAVFGPTDHVATAPRTALARIVREPLDCSPCKLRECPIDHRCMTRIPAEQVADAALELLK